MADNIDLPFPDAGLDYPIQSPEQNRPSRAVKVAQRALRSISRAHGRENKVSNASSRVHKNVLQHRSKTQSNPWGPHTPVDLSQSMQLRSGRSVAVFNKIPRPPAKSSILDDRNRGLKDLEAALPQIQVPGRVSKTFRQPRDGFLRKGNRVKASPIKNAIPSPPFWLSDLCLLLSCGCKKPHVHTKHEVTSNLGWGRTSIELFNDHLALYHRSTNGNISNPELHRSPQQSGDEIFESIETEAMSDLRWRPCIMLDEFGSGTVALRLTLPVVANIPESKCMKKGGENSASFDEACLRSQTSMGRHNHFKGRPLIGPVRPERSSRYQGEGNSSFDIGVSGAADEMEDLDIEQDDVHPSSDCQPQ